jgi:hypothetical protein
VAGALTGSGAGAACSIDCCVGFGEDGTGGSRSNRGSGRRLVFGRGVESRSKEARIAVLGGAGKLKSVLKDGADGRPNESFEGPADMGGWKFSLLGRAVRGVNSNAFAPSTGLSSTLGLREPVS